MNTSKYFSDSVSLSQISCPCGCDGVVNDRLLIVLDKVREKFGKPININSGFRCESHDLDVHLGLLKKRHDKDEINRVKYKELSELESAKDRTSSHIKGLAVDIRCDNSLDRFKLINILLAYLPVMRIGIAKTFIHIDIDEDKPQNVMWTY